MTFEELNRKMQSLFNGERFTEEDFAKFLAEKGVKDAEHHMQVIDIL